MVFDHLFRVIFLVVSHFLIMPAEAKLSVLDPAKQLPKSFEEAERVFSISNDPIRRGDLENLSTFSDEEDRQYFDCKGNQSVVKCQDEFSPYLIEYPNFFYFGKGKSSYTLNTCKGFFSPEYTKLRGAKYFDTNAPVFIDQEQFKLAYNDFSPRIEITPALREAFKKGMLFTGQWTPTASQILSYPEFIRNNFATDTKEFSIFVKANEMGIYNDLGDDITQTYRKNDGYLMFKVIKNSGTSPGVIGYGFCYRFIEPSYCTSAAVIFHEGSYYEGNLLAEGHTIFEAREKIEDDINKYFSEDDYIGPGLNKKLKKKVVCAKNLRDLDLKAIIIPSQSRYNSRRIPPILVPISKLKRF
ncbi:MAG: hypothetical protein ACXVCR_19600 [Bdellovibrio sp.]